MGVAPYLIFGDQKDPDHNLQHWNKCQAVVMAGEDPWNYFPKEVIDTFLFITLWTCTRPYGIKKPFLEVLSRSQMSSPGTGGRREGVELNDV